MKWLLIFIIMSMDAPIYLEYRTSDDCYKAGEVMQIQLKNHSSIKSIAAPYNTFACVEQE